MEDTLKFVQIATGEARDGEHILYALTKEGVIWSKTKKGWVEVDGPVVKDR